jgi:hypothetical protein
VTGFAIVGIGLFAIALVAIAVSIVVRIVRAYRTMRRLGGRGATLSWALETMQECEPEAQEELPLPAPPPPDAPPVRPGWGFESERP